VLQVQKEILELQEMLEDQEIQEIQEMLVLGGKLEMQEVLEQLEMVVEQEILDLVVKVDQLGMDLQTQVTLDLEVAEVAEVGVQGVINLQVVVGVGELEELLLRELLVDLGGGLMVLEVQEVPDLRAQLAITQVEQGLPVLQEPLETLEPMEVQEVLGL
jgi:hypothetical protein